MPPKKMKSAMAKSPAKPRNKTPMRSAMKAASSMKAAPAASKSPRVSVASEKSVKEVSVSKKKEASSSSKSKPLPTGGDVLDQLIQKVTVPGLLCLICAALLAGSELFGEPDNWNLHLCALVLGMGRGGVPGCATVAAAFFVLLAPDGGVKQMLALMTIAEFVPNFLVGVAYKDSAHWTFAAKVNAYTIIGLALGNVATEYLSDVVIRRAAGVILFSVMGQMTYEKIKRRYASSDSSSKSALAKKDAFLRSPTVMLPLGVVGGLLSYVAGNMGPILNVYLVLLALPKYELVGTRAAIFIPVDLCKIIGAYMSGYLLMPDVLADAGWWMDKCLEVTTIDSLFGNGFKVYGGAGTSDTAALSSEYGFYFGLRLGMVGVVGVLLAKVWLRKASKEFFSFIYERVTYVMTGVMGTLLCIGMSFGDLLKIGAEWAAEVGEALEGITV